MSNSGEHRALAKEMLGIRRHLEPHKFFLPNPAQKPILESPAMEKWIFGGNGLGKTAMDCVIAIWHMTGDYPKWFPENLRAELPSHGAMSTTTFTNAIEKGLIDEFSKWCPGGLGNAQHCRFKWDSRRKRIIDKVTGSVLDFFSYDQDPRDWAGPTKDYWLWDEHGTFKHYQEAKRALRGKPGHFFGTLTPTEGMTWEFEIVYEQADGQQLAVFGGKTSDNDANLREGYKEGLVRGLSEEEAKMRLTGAFLELSGLVYPQFDHTPTTGHICDAFPVNEGEACSWPKLLVIDPGYRNPCAALWLTVDPDEEIYFYREYYEVKCTVKENAKNLVEATPLGEPIEYVLIDPSVKGHELSTHETLLQQFEDAFLELDRSWPLYPANNEKTAGLAAVRTRLQEKTVHFFPDLANTFKEFRRYVHQSQRYKSITEKNKKEAPKEYMDHLMDCVRYAIMDDPVYYEVGSTPEKVEIGVLNVRTGY